MKVTHGHADGQPSEQRDATFTGTVWADPVLSGDGAPTIATVVFPPAARTHWHHHEHGQVLFVTHGRGFVQVRDGDGAVVRAGDVVWFPPAEVHWHGALGDTFLTHTAVSLGTTAWLEAVSDADYARVTALP
jgi:quercetin dioxygenase-like cupin family protein